MRMSIVQTATQPKRAGFKDFRLRFSRAMVPACGLLLAVTLSACSGERPKGLGVNKGRLASCPLSPNCVSTHSGEDRKHFIQPLMFSAHSAEVMGRVRRAVKSQERTQIIQEKEHYIYAEFESQVFGFVDDVEFYFEAKTGTLHVRSASRIGESDLGVNRERVELMFSLLKKTDKKPSA